MIHVQHKVVDMEWSVGWARAQRNIPVLTTSETSDSLSVVSNNLGSMSSARKAENNTGDR